MGFFIDLASHLPYYRTRILARHSRLRTRSNSGQPSTQFYLIARSRENEDLCPELDTVFWSYGPCLELLFVAEPGLLD
jgi:hypothetical protein